MLNNKGFSNIVILLIIFIVLGILSWIYYFNPQDNRPAKVETQITSNTAETKASDKFECATPDMFDQASPKILKPLSTIETEEMNFIDFDFLGIVSFKTNNSDLILNVPELTINNNDVLYIANKLLPGDPGSWVTSSYVFKKENCIPSIPPHQVELDVKIKKIVITESNLTIFERPGCCTGYNEEASYYLELPIEYQNKVNARYILITPWYYSLEEFEKVLRSLKFIPIN
jgi:hypothetical protein